jgi:pyrophosphatase PpaX
MHMPLIVCDASDGTLRRIGDVRFPVVLFDFDGTIVDSAAVIEDSFRHTVATVLGRELDRAELPVIFRAGALEAQMTLLDPGRVPDLTSVYRAAYAERHERVQAFPGMIALLETLRAEGRRLGIVSSKRTAMVELAFGLLPLGHFDVIVGAEDTERQKPDPLPLLHALERLGASPQEAVYVGDAPVDVECARAAGIHALAVTWGGLFPVAQTLAAQPDAVAHRVEELLALL